MMNLWQPIAESVRWNVLASRECRNGGIMEQFLPLLAAQVQALAEQFPIDAQCVVSSGYSGGAMLSHAFAYYFPTMVRGVIVNCGKIHDEFIGSPFAGPRFAAFIASPGDFRYKEMQRDRRYLDEQGWDTTWIEFAGGHRVAPPAVYRAAVDWVITTARL